MEDFVITPALLEELGFNYEATSSGNCWVLNPESDSRKIALANCLGYVEFDEYECPEEVILQCDSTFHSWCCICDGDYDELSYNEACAVLKCLNG